MVFYESSIKQRALNRLTELTISQVEHARTYDSDGKTQEVRVADHFGRYCTRSTGRTSAG